VHEAGRSRLRHRVLVLIGRSGKAGVTTSEGPTREQLARRLERERRARQQAEDIAEEATSRLYGALEELKSLNDALRDFVAIAAHDLRAPITTVLGFAELLAADWHRFDDGERQGHVRTIGRSARSMARLAEDLLTISRIEADALDTRPEIIELDRAIREATQAFRGHASQISTRIERGVRVDADPDHVGRILTNVLGNAIKYGGPPFEIDVDIFDPWVEIRISDHGDGVPAGFVPRLFSRFARSETSAREKPGTGLGLSIVRGLARANGGDVWYEPNAPRGSCFAVRLRGAA
jgi:signal transduction histidine kinase